jgi:hypothetical protein
MWQSSHTFLFLSAIFRLVFNKEKYNNGYLRNRCAILRVEIHITLSNLTPPLLTLNSTTANP